MHVWNVLRAACWKYRTQNIAIFGSIAQICRALSSQLRHVSTIGKKLVKQRYLLHMSHNMVNFGLLTAEICWRVWGTPANFNGFRIVEALLLGNLVVGVSQTLRRWTEGATYIRQGDDHVGHLPTFQLWSPYVIGQTIIFSCCGLLWSPYVIGQTIIFLPCDFYLLSFFFPRLISAVGDWMSTILPHMVWP